jgi:hypothetical protein
MLYSAIWLPYSFFFISILNARLILHLDARQQIPDRFLRQIDGLIFG